MAPVCRCCRRHPPHHAREPVDRQIEGYLSEEIGQCDLASLIRPRSTEPIEPAAGCRDDRPDIWSQGAFGPVREILLASRGPLRTPDPWATAGMTRVYGTRRLPGDGRSAPGNTSSASPVSAIARARAIAWALASIAATFGRRLGDSPRIPSI